VLRRGGCSRREPAERPPIVRYEWPCPGNLLHMDVKRFGKFEAPGHALTGDRTRRSRRAGWESVHSIVDDCSRRAYGEIHDDEKAATVTAYTRPRARLLPCPRHRRRAADDRQRLRLHPQPLTARAAARPRQRAPAHPPLHAQNQRQGRALPADSPARMGLRHAIRVKQRPSRLAATLAAPLQRAAHPQRPRQPPRSHAFGRSPGSTASPRAASAS
jgi:hypothetical protein